MGKTVQEDFEGVRDAIKALSKHVTAVPGTSDTGAVIVRIPCRDRGPLGAPPAFVVGTVRRSKKGREITAADGNTHVIGGGAGWQGRMARKLLELAGWR